MEAPSRLGAQLSLTAVGASKWEQEGWGAAGEGGSVHFPFGWSFCVSYFIQQTCRVSPGMCVKNSKGDGYHMTTDLVLYNS